MNHIESARAANAKGTIAWTVTLDEAHAMVDEFKKACPKASSAISIDWDDDTMYRVTFRWEPGTFGTPVTTVSPLVERRKTEPKVRSGERW
jgi:hypothetical protein